LKLGKVPQKAIQVPTLKPLARSVQLKPAAKPVQIKKPSAKPAVKRVATKPKSKYPPKLMAAIKKVTASGKHEVFETKVGSIGSYNYLLVYMAEKGFKPKVKAPSIKVKSPKSKPVKVTKKSNKAKAVKKSK